MKGKILISMIATGLLATSLSFADDTMGGNSAGDAGNDTGIATDSGLNDNSNNNGTQNGSSMGTQGNDSSSSTPDNATGDDY